MVNIITTYKNNPIKLIINLDYFFNTIYYGLIMLSLSVMTIKIKSNKEVEYLELKRNNFYMLKTFNFKIIDNVKNSMTEIPIDENITIINEIYTSKKRKKIPYNEILIPKDSLNNTNNIDTNKIIEDTIKHKIIIKKIN